MPRKQRIDLAGYHHVKLLEEELENLEKIKNQKSIKKENVIRLANERKLEEHFLEYKTLKERNNKIVTALDDVYSQISIANYFNVSRSLVYKIVREEMDR